MNKAAHQYKNKINLDIRPSSERLHELHIYIVPCEKWLERRKLAKNQVMDYAISLGFVRVMPEILLADLREEMFHQLRDEVLPENFVFLRSVGRNFTQVKQNQELEMKAKYFGPPLAKQPEVYLLEGTYISRMNSSVDESDADEWMTSNKRYLKQSVMNNRSINGKIINKKTETSELPLKQKNTARNGRISTKQVSKHIKTTRKIQNVSHTTKRPATTQSSVLNESESNGKESIKLDSGLADTITESWIDAISNDETDVKENKTKIESKTKKSETTKVAKIGARARNITRPKLQIHSKYRNVKASKVHNNGRSKKVGGSRSKNEVVEEIIEKKTVKELGEKRNGDLQEKIHVLEYVESQDKMLDESGNGKVTETSVEDDGDDKKNELLKMKNHSKYRNVKRSKIRNTVRTKKVREKTRKETSPEGKITVEETVEMITTVEPGRQDDETQHDVDNENQLLASSGDSVNKRSSIRSQDYDADDDDANEQLTIDINAELINGVDNDDGEKTDGGDNEDQQQDQNERENLLEILKLAKAERKETEKRRDEVFDELKNLQNRMSHHKHQIREQWKKRYIETKKITPQLEEKCSRLKQELEKVQRKFLYDIDSRERKKNTSNNKFVEKPSQKLTHRISISRLKAEIDDLTRRVQTTKMRLSAEVKLRSQAEKEVKMLRQELTSKKINVSLQRSQNVANFANSRNVYLGVS